MGRLAPRLAGADVDRRLAQIDRNELRMQVGHVQQRDVAIMIECQQLILGDALLRGGASDRAETARRHSGADLQNVATGNHDMTSQCLMPGTLSLRPALTDARYSSRSPCSLASGGNSLAQTATLHH